MGCRAPWSANQCVPPVEFNNSSSLVSPGPGLPTDHRPPLSLRTRPLPVMSASLWAGLGSLLAGCAAASGATEPTSPQDTQPSSIASAPAEWHCANAKQGSERTGPWMLGLAGDTFVWFAAKGDGNTASLSVVHGLVSRPVQLEVPATWTETATGAVAIGHGPFGGRRRELTLRGEVGRWTYGAVWDGGTPDNPRKFTESEFAVFLGNGATPSERIAPLLSCVHTFDKLTGADAWYEPPGRRLEWVGVSFDPDLVVRVRVKRGEPWLLLAKEDRGGVQVLRRPLAPHAPRSSPWRAQ